MATNDSDPSLSENSARMDPPKPLPIIIMCLLLDIHDIGPLAGMTGIHSFP